MQAIPQPDRIDEAWQWIHLQFRTGDYSWRQLAALARAQFGAGPSHEGIRKRAEREQWTQDLRADVRAEAQRHLLRQPAEGVELLTATEDQAVAMAGRLQADVIRAHRADAVKLRAIVDRLLEATVREVDLATEASKAQIYRSAPDALEKAQTVAMRSMGLAKELHGLERRAFGIDDASPVPTDAEDVAADTLEAALGELAERLALGDAPVDDPGAEEGADLVPIVLPGDVPVRIDTPVAGEGADPDAGEADDDAWD